MIAKTAQILYTTSMPEIKEMFSGDPEENKLKHAENEEILNDKGEVVGHWEAVEGLGRLVPVYFKAGEKQPNFPIRESNRNLKKGHALQAVEKKHEQMNRDEGRNPYTGIKED